MLGSRAYIDIQSKCYFLTANRSEPEILGSSVFTMCGYLKDKPGSQMGIYYGYFGVPEYPIPIETGHHNYAGGLDERFVVVHNMGWATMGFESTAEYLVYVTREKEPVVFMTINLEDGSSLVAVCGASETEAIDNYYRFWDIFRDESEIP